MRPAGERGGHTVQEAEQAAAGVRRTMSDPPVQDAPAASSAPQAVGDSGPAIEPIYLRPGRTGGHEAAFRLPTETLVDAVTRTVLGLLESSLRENVEATVRALAPRIIVSFALSPEDGESSDDAEDDATSDEDAGEGRESA